MTSVGMSNANAAIASTVVPTDNLSRCVHTIERNAPSIASIAFGVNNRFNVPRTRSCRGGSMEMIEYLRPLSSGFSGAGPMRDEKVSQSRNASLTSA